MNIRDHAILMMMIFSIVLSSCSPSEKAIQTAIVQTQQVASTKQKNIEISIPSPTNIEVLGTNTPISSPTTSLTNTPKYTPTITLTYTITNTATNTPIPSKTPTSTVTPSPAPTEDLFLHLSLTEFILKYNNLTDLQKKDFVVSLPGKKVQWTGVVVEVYDNGKILIDIPGTLASSVSLNGIPIAEVKSVNKNSSISFTATIKSLTDFLGLHIELVDGKITK